MHPVLVVILYQIKNLFSKSIDNYWEQCYNIDMFASEKEYYYKKLLL